MHLDTFKKKRDEFLLYINVEKNLAKNTIRSYKGDLEQFIRFWENLPDQDEKHLSPRQVIERFLVGLFYKKIDKSTIARKFSCFKSFEKFLLAQGTTLNLKLKRPKLEKKLPIYLSIDEIFYLLDTVKDEDLPSKHPIRDKAVFELIYATGIRCSELTNIRLKNIDFDNKTVRIFGKGNKERIVLFGNKARDKVLHYMKFERPTPYSQEEFLFLNYRNTPLTSRSVQRIFQMFRTFLKVERPITPHKIRHSFATHLLNQGADLRVVQELLGHATLSSTEKYTHVSLENLSEICETKHPINALFHKKQK